MRGEVEFWIKHDRPIKPIVDGWVLGRGRHVG